MISDMSYTVYVHTSPSNKKYVGITMQITNKRWKNGEGYKFHHPHFYAAIKKYGWNNFEHEIVCQNISKEEAEKKEIELIGLFKSNLREFGYNVSNGGNCAGKHSEETRRKISLSNIGRVVSKETREKISKSNKGKPGRPISKEQKEALRLANLGKKISEETRKKLINSHTGKKWTEQQKNNFSKSRKGKPKPSIYRKVIQIDAKNNEMLRVFESMKFAAEATNTQASNITATCKGFRKTAGGYVWAYGGEKDFTR